ncbi:MAG: CDP-diacylglycerol--glycerol-3-phosphate 3-phosphatidyltransferase [Bacilli bacterium]|nr:CDP-diacylglycerol--glycerol-3-phosphate 3-phosphatidyltransferase [Bacilli bacterium]MDD4076513.1 CDP-diacylglycerol--glycerol-3-phosphate 3-phosphatidyltransferase [Bacilli bacterium]MDD4387730.1 CDP-diacylglycerol--glycerol-3-phosphate 3-phosphatidyltransferase [Bacilli bacterium]
MNLPNKLTLSRIFVIPIIITVSLIPIFHNTVLFGEPDLGTEITLENIVLLVIFILASFTDYLDGHIARKNNIITNFGKFMDPLADKLLVFSTIIVLLERERFAAFGLSLGFVVTLMIAREFIVTGIRLIAVSENVVIAASKLGKIKTVSQMIMIIFLLVNCYPLTFLGSYTQEITALVLIIIAGLLTLISGLDYFLKNKALIFEKK